MRPGGEAQPAGERQEGAGGEDRRAHHRRRRGLGDPVLEQVYAGSIAPSAEKGSGPRRYFTRRGCLVADVCNRVAFLGGVRVNELARANAALDDMLAAVLLVKLRFWVTVAAAKYDRDWTAQSNSDCAMCGTTPRKIERALTNHLGAAHLPDPARPAQRETSG